MEYNKNQNDWITMKTFHILCYAIFLVLMGCATTKQLEPNQFELTLNSSPEGALIYEKGEALKQAPFTVVITASEANMRDGFVPFKEVFAVWPSGAKTNVTTVRAAAGRGPQTYTFSRPPDAPRLDIDLAHVETMRNTRATERQAKASEQSASSDQFFGQLLLQTLTPPQNTRRTTNCMNMGKGDYMCNSY